MIHRYMEVPEVVVTNDAIFLYKLQHELSGGVDRKERWWLGGNLGTPIPITSTLYTETTGTVRRAANTARITADRSRVLYARGDISTVTPAPDQIVISAGPSPWGTGSTDVIATANTNSSAITYPDWPDDASVVVYAKEATGGYGEIRSVLPDGTSDTLLYSRGGSLAGELMYFNIEGMLVSPDGGKVAWVDQCQSVGGLTNAGIYIVNIDGSSPTRIVDWSAGTFTTSDHLIGWSHDSAYLAFTWTFGGVVHTYKVNMSGTTTDLTGSGAYFRQQYDYQWLPDDSGVLCVQANVYGTQPRSVIGVLSAAGTGYTALSPERRIDTSGTITTPNNYPVVWDLDDRIYWYDLASTSVVSVAADGSDFRTDHTLDATDADINNDQNFRTLYTGT